MKNGHKLNLSKEIVIKALIDNNGFVSFAAKQLKCSEQNIRNYIYKYNDVKEALDNIRENILDICENTLYEFIVNKDFDAIKYYLKYQGASRNYSDSYKSQLTIKTENEFEIPKTPKQLAAYKEFIKTMNEND